MYIDFEKLRKSGWTVEADSKGVNVYSHEAQDFDRLVKSLQHDHGIDRHLSYSLADKIHVAQVLSSLMVQADTD